MASTKGVTENELFFDIPEIYTHTFDHYDSFYTSPAVGTFEPNYVYATTHHLISSSSSIATIVPSAYTIDSLVRYFINGLSGRNYLVNVNKIMRLFLFNIDNVVMKTLEATTKLGGFNQRLLMI